VQNSGIISKIDPQANDYYLFFDISGLRGGTRRARKQYVENIINWHKQYPFNMLVFCGANRLLRAATNLARTIAPFKIRIVNDVESALKLIEKDRQEKENPSPPQIAQEYSRGEKIEHYVDELLQFVGKINWESDGVEHEKEIDSSHPFEPVFDAIELIKLDLDTLFQERKLAEEELRKSEERYRDIFNNVSDFLYSHDLEGYFTNINDAWKRAYGYEEDELVGLHAKDLIPKKYWHEFEKYLQKVLENGHNEGQMVVRVKDGVVRIFEYRNSLVFDSNGPVGVRGSARDITVRVESEKALRESEEKYRTILENIEDGCFEVDIAGNFTFFNDSMCRILGYSKNELMGMNNRQYMDEETASRVYRTFNRVYSSGVPEKGFSWEFIKKDGARVFVESSVSLITDGTGKSVGFRGILRDVTDRKEAEEKIKRYSEHLEDMVAQRTDDLRRSEEKYRTILENIEDGYYEVDLKGQLTFFNDALCKITGYNRDELMGMNTLRLTNEEHAKTLFDEYHKVYLTGVPTKQVDWARNTRQGETKFLENSVTLIRDGEGKPTGFRGIVRDVTGRKHLEQELIEKREQAVEASRAKSDFLANMSHEIRTPLNGIIGMTELGLNTELNDEQSHIFHTLSYEANSLLQLVNEVLDFSKIEAGKLELEEIPFDLGILMEDVAKTMAHRAEKRGLELISFLAPDVPEKVEGDPGRLRQVLVNLMGNALKFTHEGEIYVKAERLEEEKKRVKVRFEVQDTGIGIAKEKQARIFDSFTQVDGSTTRKYGGTGLGTSISKQLVELMGGEIGMESEEGKGSTFWFTADFGKQKGGEKRKLTQEEATLVGLKVLVVDDNPTSRFILKEYLSTWGCLPGEAEGGEEALKTLRHTVRSGEFFDFIITDHQMFAMSGFDLAQEVKESDALKKTPMILLSSLGSIGDGKRCREIGIEGYLSKPIKRDELKRAMISILDVRESEGAAGDKALVTRHSMAERDRGEIQILLAEDYPTNQQVALRHLSGAGYTVDLAENGQMAVDAFRRKRYDLVLMDIQMPVLDGYEATQEIRELERQRAESHSQFVAGSRKRKIPIIAMTAHATKEHGERCMKAGMDDYISKPLRSKDLLELIEKWLEKGLGKEDETKEAGIKEEALGENGRAPMDFEVALDEFAGDKDFLMEVLEGFLGSVRTQAETLRQALEDGDADVVFKEAHSIKGGAANMTAEDLYHAAVKLENLGESGDLGDAAPALRNLETQFRRLEEYKKAL